MIPAPSWMAFLVPAGGRSGYSRTLRARSFALVSLTQQIGKTASGSSFQNPMCARTLFPSTFRTFHSVGFHCPVIPLTNPAGSAFSSSASKVYTLSAADQATECTPPLPSTTIKTIESAFMTKRSFVSISEDRQHELSTENMGDH